MAIRHNHKQFNEYIKRLVAEYLSEGNNSLKDILHYSGDDREEVANTINGLQNIFSGKEDVVKNTISKNLSVFGEVIKALPKDIAKASNKNKSSIVKKFGIDSDVALYDFLTGRNEIPLYNIISEDIALIIGDVIQEGFEEDEYYAEYGEIISTVDNLSDSGLSVTEELGESTNVLKSIKEFSDAIRSENWLDRSMVNGCKYYAKVTGQECNRELYENIKDKIRDQIASMILTVPVFLFNQFLEKNNVSESGFIWEILLVSLIHPKYLTLYHYFVSRIGLPNTTYKLAKVLKLLNNKPI